VLLPSDGALPERPRTNQKDLYE